MSLLQLGTFVFETDDMPDKIEVGGQQIAAVYQYPGGIKDVQIFGALDDTITIQGTFNYSNAPDKVVAIDTMFRSGKEYLLKIDAFKSLSVVITKFKPVYRSSIAIDYTIDMEPLSSSYTLPGSGISTDLNNSTSSKVVSTSPPSYSPPKQRTYEVVKGDNLWNIAKKYYGSGTLYTKIYNANKNIIKYPNLIYPGQHLIIP